jgi:hypothetical protein
MGLKGNKLQETVDQTKQDNEECYGMHYLSSVIWVIKFREDEVGKSCGVYQEEE